LPRIENCPQLRNLVVQQGNNYVWWYIKKYEKIQVKTTVRELDEACDQNIVRKDKSSMKCENIASLDDDNSTARNEDDDDIIWIEDPIIVARRPSK
jgi:hypothetical protein